MTTREFYVSIINGDDMEAVQTFAAEALKKLDERNAKRNEKKEDKNADLKNSIMNWIENLEERREVVSAEIAEALKGDYPDITTNKAASVLRQLADDGKLTQGEKKMPKKGKVKCYTIA